MVSYHKSCLSRYWLDYVTILLQSLVCSLLVYSLIIRGGDVAVNGCQKVGFYNYCLYNKTLEDCECFSQLEDLSLVRGTSQFGLVLAIILTYSSLVTVIMALLTITFAHCFEESILWMLAHGLNVLSLAGLSLGTIVYFSLTWDLFDISQVTPGFLALLAAVSALPVLCCIMRRYTGLTRGLSKSKTVSTADLL